MKWFIQVGSDTGLQHVVQRSFIITPLPGSVATPYVRTLIVCHCAIALTKVAGLIQLTVSLCGQALDSRDNLVPQGLDVHPVKGSVRIVHVSTDGCTVPTTLSSLVEPNFAVNVVQLGSQF